MFTTILEYLANNKTIVVGATVTLAEVIVIIVNTWRKLRANRIAAASYYNVGTPESKLYQPPVPLKKVNVFLWAINPINLFRRA